jgi:hypothetical protein
MKVLLPSTDSQTLKIVPREYVEASNLTMVVTEDGTRKTETLSSLTSTVDGNYISIPCTFSILSEGKLYSLELKQGSDLLFRDKIYCTAQTDRTQKQTLNTNKYIEHSAEPSGQKYITI